jgi:O-antigen ligase
MLGLILVAVFMVPALPANRRAQLMALACAAGFAMTVAVPGLLGTLKTFFLLGEADDSISARTQDYELVTRFFNHSPVWGNGFATFVPSEYDFLDNQYLLTIVEAGVLGLIGLALLFFAGIAATRTIRKRANDSVTRDLAQALMASVIVHLVTFATYDAMVFRTTGLSLFLILGAIGSLWRLTPPPGPPVPAAAPTTSHGATA